MNEGKALVGLSRRTGILHNRLLSAVNATGSYVSSRRYRGPTYKQLTAAVDCQDPRP
jgi:hypothetical protein